jgi:hypothetical protein
MKDLIAEQMLFIPRLIAETGGEQDVLDISLLQSVMLATASGSILTAFTTEEKSSC